MALIVGGVTVTGTQVLDATKLSGNLPAISGASLTGISSNAPSFLAYLTSNQSIPNNTYQKINLNGEYFDTGGCYNNTSGSVTLNGVSAPAYSFAPNVAGKYLIGAKGRNDTSSDSSGTIVRIEKNDVAVSQVRDTLDNSEGLFVSTIVDLDGTDDYVTMVQYQNSGGAVNANGASTFANDDATISHMFGFLIGGA